MADRRTALGNQGNSGRGNSGGKTKKISTHYGLNNHIVDECYWKHGYPLGHRLHNSQSSNINNVNAMKEEGDNSTLNQNQDAQNEDVRLTP